MTSAYFQCAHCTDAQLLVPPPFRRIVMESNSDWFSSLHFSTWKKPAARWNRWKQGIELWRSFGGFCYSNFSQKSSLWSTLKSLPYFFRFTKFFYPFVFVAPSHRFLLLLEKKMAKKNDAVGQNVKPRGKMSAYAFFLQVSKFLHGYPGEEKNCLHFKKGAGLVRNYLWMEGSDDVNVKASIKPC